MTVWFSGTCRYRQKLGSGLKVYGVTQWLQPRKGENLFVRAKFVIDTLNNFMASSDAHITSLHVPNHRLKDDGTTEEIPQKSKMVSTCLRVKCVHACVRTCVCLCVCVCMHMHACMCVPV